MGGGLCPWVRWLGCEADSSHPCVAKVKRAWSYISSSPYIFMTCLSKHRSNFTFLLYFLFNWRHNSFNCSPPSLAWCQIILMFLLSHTINVLCPVNIVHGTPSYPSCTRNGVCQVHESGGCMRKTYSETQYKVRKICFCFSSCVGGFLSDIADWGLKGFRYM
jgi:hypothetical protein